MDFTGQVCKRVWKLTIFLVWEKVRIWRTGRTPPPRIPKSTTRDPGPTMKTSFVALTHCFIFVNWSKSLSQRVKKFSTVLHCTLPAEPLFRLLNFGVQKKESAWLEYDICWACATCCLDIVSSPQGAYFGFQVTGMSKGLFWVWQTEDSWYSPLIAAA